MELIAAIRVCFGWITDRNPLIISQDRQQICTNFLVFRVRP